MSFYIEDNTIVEAFWQSLGCEGGQNCAKCGATFDSRKDTPTE